MPSASNRPTTTRLLRGSRRLPPPPHGCRQKVLHPWLNHYMSNMQHADIQTTHVRATSLAIGRMQAMRPNSKVNHSCSNIVTRWVGGSGCQRSRSRVACAAHVVYRRSMKQTKLIAWMTISANEIAKLHGCLTSNNGTSD